MSHCHQVYLTVTLNSVFKPSYSTVIVFSPLGVAEYPETLNKEVSVIRDIIFHVIPNYKNTYHN